mmetsp:Transcript_33558/g.60169  ORF Transcript_33558/g.60169 Transcript_33558/m.60169 type:complete len:403 (+) Transcript_33558:325-1533(+)
MGPGVHQDPPEPQIEDEGEIAEAQRDTEDAEAGSTQVSILMNNWNRRMLRQWILARLLQEAPRPPDLIVGVESNVSKYDPTPPGKQYERVAFAPASTCKNRGVEIFLHRNSPWRVETQHQAPEGDALLAKVYTTKTHWHLLVVHAPQLRKVQRLGYIMYWLRLWEKVRQKADMRRLIIVGDMNSAYRPGDRAIPRSCDVMYRYFCSLVGLNDLSDLVDLPPGETSCTLKSGSRIDTAAVSVDSKITVSDAVYWNSTLLSDHHKPLLMRAQVPNIPLRKHLPTCHNRLPEHHLPPVRLTTQQQADYAEAVARRTTVDPLKEPIQWIRQLQLAMYEWAKEHGYVVTRSYEQAEPDERPYSETREEVGGEPMQHSEEMLPTVERAFELLAVEMGRPGHFPSEKEI